MKILASQKLIIWTSFLLPLTLLAGIYPKILLIPLNWLLLILCISGIDWMISWGFPERLAISLPPEISLVQSKSKKINLNIMNVSKYPLFLRVGFDADPDLVFTPGEINEYLDGHTEHTIPIALESGNRGEKWIENICLEVRSYLGFFLIRQKRNIAHRIKVYPNIFLDNQQLAASLLLRSESGLRSQRVIGHGRDFEQLRDYLPDDHFSDIAWKATAKKGHPITKVFQMERTQQIYIALDYSRSSYLTFGNRSNLDVAIEAILLMQLFCDRMGDMLGLIIFADRILKYCPAGKGRAHFGILRNLVYNLVPKPVTPDFENLFIFIKQRIRKRVLILLFSNIEDPGLATNFFNDVAIIKRSHLVTLCTFNGYEPHLLFSKGPVAKVSQIYEKLAAQLSNDEQQKISSMLKKQNVDMLRFIPQKFSLGVIEHYMNIKRRQML